MGSWGCNQRTTIHGNGGNDFFGQPAVDPTLEASPFCGPMYFEGNTGDDTFDIYLAGKGSTEWHITGNDGLNRMYIHGTEVRDVFLLRLGFIALVEGGDTLLDNTVEYYEGTFERVWHDTTLNDGITINGHGVRYPFLFCVCGGGRAGGGGCMCLWCVRLGTGGGTDNVWRRKLGA